MRCDAVRCGFPGFFSFVFLVRSSLSWIDVSLARRRIPDMYRFRLCVGSRVYVRARKGRDSIAVGRGGAFGVEDVCSRRGLGAGFGFSGKVYLAFGGCGWRGVGLQWTCTFRLLFLDRVCIVDWIEGRSALGASHRGAKGGWLRLDESDQG
ncbi:hypothetical protein BS50DRAFT_386232 [Corynespora cassiicola Philippines]|uniref:Uncharacterized protein n=1 Tax=Corynespora cassiicola Philippines TaxID=1448308 RepID=A0A2T2NPP2_CORCC|nr:hypothetical protein BS50DRAFT_386232 [Corynespora cassiicola Philippines]